MRYHIKIYIVLFLSVLTISCRKYVESVPIQGQRVIEYTDDYRMLLNNNDMMQVAYGLAPVLSSDDVDFEAANLQTNIKNNLIQTNMYTWNKPFYVLTQSDNDWNAVYNGIYTYNTVIQDVMNSKSGSDLVKKGLLGEALVHRAFSYFMLVNMYAKQYDAQTASSDFGVPLLLEPKLFVNLSRTPVQQVYSKIVEDTKRAIPLLPITQEIKFRPNKASAYALLSKTYLFMRDFDKSLLYADSTLQLSSAVYDYNTSLTTIPSQYNDVQVLLRKVPRQTLNTIQLSNSLLTLLGTKDLRYVMFVRDGANFFPAFTGKGFWARSRYDDSDQSAVGLSVNETLLIKAECLMRTGKVVEGIQILNNFRKSRFRPSDYVDLTASNAEEGLRLVVQERRLEFFGTGMRWFDQRRLGKDPGLIPTYTRKLGDITYTLEPNSNKYVFPFSTMIISQNPEIIQNPN